VQYAGDGSAAPDIYFRLGEAMLGDDRPGEAIAPLRRAANLGADGGKVWPMLARALVLRGRYVAALGAVLEARAAGATAELLQPSIVAIEAELGPALGPWKALTEPAS